MTIDQAVLLAHAGSTLFMVGLIWLVQLVHYPLFAHIDKHSFPAYVQTAQRKTTWVVGPPMLIEIVSAVWLLVHRPDSIPGSLLWAGIALLLIIWLSTAFLQIPCHGILAQGFNRRAHQFLVNSNWVRTVAWSLRAGVVARGCAP